jgi:hypothetical protein
MAEVLLKEEQAGVRSIQEVNATFTTTNSGTDKTFEIALATTVDKAKSEFIPTGQASGHAILPEGSASGGIYLKTITIKSDGTALEVKVFDNQVGTFRLSGYVKEWKLVS